MDGFRILFQQQCVTYTRACDANGRAKAADVMPDAPPRRLRRRPAPRGPNPASARPPQQMAPATNHGPDAIPWGANVVPAVIERGTVDFRWMHHQTQPQQGHLVILHKPNPNGGVKQMKLNIWCTTGTVGSYLKHPKQGNTQLFRRQISTWSELDAILRNPRVHTDKGFQRKRRRPPRKWRLVPCTSPSAPFDFQAKRNRMRSQRRTPLMPQARLYAIACTQEGPKGEASQPTALTTSHLSQATFAHEPSC